MVIGIALVVIVVVAILLKGRDKKSRREVQKPGNESGMIGRDTEKKEAVTIIKDGKEQKGTVIYMAEGMQVFDENGNIVINTTDTICNSIGYVEVDGKTSGVIANTAIKKSRTWAAVVFPKWNPDLAVLMMPVPPNITIEDGKISYSYKNAGPSTMEGILYWGWY